MFAKRKQSVAHQPQQANSIINLDSPRGATVFFFLSPSLTRPTSDVSVNRHVQRRRAIERIRARKELLLTYRPAAPVRPTLIGSPRDNGYPFLPSYPPPLDFPNLISKGRDETPNLGSLLRYSTIIQVDPSRSLPDGDYRKIFPDAPLTPFVPRESKSEDLISAWIE